MDLASRIVSVLLGIAVLAFLIWPVTIPLGFGQVWWAKQQGAAPPEPAPSKPAPSKPQAASPPAKPAMPAPQAEAPQDTHAIPDPEAPKPHLLASEKAEAERLAALNGKNETAAKPRPATKLYYKVKVRDAGTLESGGIVMRLAGIAARDADATCKDPKGKAWGCGAAARVALTRLIRGRAVTCALPRGGEHNIFVARCSVAGIDLSAWVVRQGWAKPKEPSEPALADAAAVAKSERIGLWRGVE